MNRRGVSPVIATILLLAFLVALGAVIMNLGATLTQAGCAKIDTQLLQTQGQNACYFSQSNSVRFTINNQGEAIDALKITFSGKGTVSKEIREVIPAQTQVQKEISSVPATDVNTILIIPMVKDSDGKYSYCQRLMKTYENIPVCVN